ncbi:uncharacterized protein FOMMEDRAFT_167736 [Fomitiporia mediterranea MF3/22]|uniref:uncharacterized protein n=1 Tax=Fomitiporia mediterranea (strain MF3/22) TaxID=694068 RepID=UPI00044072C2|nr:uncharacterized protein FOMMEDRAFT_167736 [Fomitiporia mediterranea MF3/22]EJD04577.1 hypothetical protein FOMMEDRAFT_167736 [Fomitiporia mediterranea MF3/22]
MPINDAQKKAIEEVISAITSTAAGSRGKRKLADMFLELPDRDAWPEYYEVIPEPRCIDGVKFKLGRTDKKGYDKALDVYEDLALVFLNALYYNEEGSQIAKDASLLKGVFSSEWKKRSVLPTPSDELPAASVQRQKQKSSQKPAQPAASSSSSKNLPQTPATKATANPKQVKATPAPAPATASAPIPVAQPILPQAQAQDADMDVDVGGGPSDNEAEPENYGYSGPMSTVTRDAESDDIVWQLERSLPRWGGYGDKGWFEGVDLDRCADIAHAIKSHKDVVSNSRVAAALDVIPEDIAIKNLSFNYPLSLKLIESKARAKEYASSKEFDVDMIRLFEKARRWHDIGSDQYGDVLLLQRLYQALTSPTPPPGPPYASQTNFSSIRAGPGTARPLHGSASTDSDLVPGVTTFRVSSKDRHFVDEVNYKGWSIRLADWLHLANPDDPNRPIVAQVFRCWISDEPSKAGRPGVTACWYYRPEQTYHPVNREFWEGEVFKTGHFADHPLEDVIEKIAVQFTARHLRGRPRAPFWWPGWPLYVCDSRYNDRERVFVRIKNWASCVPEEVRKKPDWMHIYEFERPVAPRRLGSPFLPQSNVKGRRGGRLPGGIGDAVERADGEKIEGGGTGRKRPRKSGVISAAPGPGPSRIAQASISTTAQQGAHASYTQQMPSHTTYNAPQQAAAASTTATPAPRPAPKDRGVITAAGGPSILPNAFTAKLPAETARYFDRDPDTNEVLWFSGPPVDVARPVTPRHSLEYLHFLAMKRKREMEGNTREESDDSKRSRTVKAPPAASQLLEELWTRTCGEATSG